MKTKPCPHCQNPIPQRKLQFCPICGLSLKSTESSLVQESLAGEVRYAPMGARLLARAIDYTLLGIVACLLDWGTDGVFVQSLLLTQEGLSNLPQIQYALWLGIVLFLGYFVIFQSLCGQTLGKWICGVVVVIPSAQIPGVARNFFRELGVWFALMSGGWLLAIYFFSPRHKSFHDFLSGVEVRSRVHL